jgi:hypothetical protein
MSDIERELSEALTARADGAYVGGGSAAGVRFLARRRTRRRGVVGAGVLVAASTLGIGALLARSPEPQRVTSAAGGDVEPGGVWRCSGPLSQVIQTSSTDPAMIEATRQFNLMRSVQPASDGHYYMADCQLTNERPDPIIGVPADTAVAATYPVDEIEAASTEAPQNSPPEANDDFAFTEGHVISVFVAANDIDPDGDAMMFELLRAPAHGQVSGGEYGSFTYQPGTGYVGTDSFVYLVRDDRGLTSTATCTITVTAVQSSG